MHFDEKAFFRIVRQYEQAKARCLFVCVPDKLGSHFDTLVNWFMYSEKLAHWPRAFVAQDGYSGMPEDADALFIGGSTAFKDSQDAYNAAELALKAGKHVHVGRVNGLSRWLKYAGIGCHTCDGSGFSRFNDRAEKLRDAVRKACGLTL